MTMRYFTFRDRVLALDAPSSVASFAAAAFAHMRCGSMRTVHHRATVSITGSATRLRFDEVEFPEQEYECEETAIFYASRDVFARFAASDPSCWAVYGAAVAFGNRAIALLGPPGAGKTVLALHLIAGGARLYGDETFVLEPTTARVEGMRRRLMIREPALRLLPDDAMRDACVRSRFVLHTKSGRIWYAVDSQAIAKGSLPAEPAPLRAVVLVTPERSGTTLDPIDASLGMMELARRRYVRANTLLELAELERVRNRTCAFRLSAADPRKAAALILEAMCR